MSLGKNKVSFQRNREKTIGQGRSVLGEYLRDGVVLVCPTDSGW
jgi:hypothetical protein